MVEGGGLGDIFGSYFFFFFWDPYFFFFLSDPDTAYPKYQEKFRYKNLNNVTHLLKPGNTLPMVQWQLSLR